MGQLFVELVNRKLRPLEKWVLGFGKLQTTIFRSYGILFSKNQRKNHYTHTISTEWRTRSRKGVFTCNNIHKSTHTDTSCVAKVRLIIEPLIRILRNSEHASLIPCHIYSSFQNSNILSSSFNIKIWTRWPWTWPWIKKNRKQTFLKD